MKKQTTKICTTALMASMVLISTFIRIPVPIGNMNTMIHLGNVFCILSGLLLGPLSGGISAGIGSFLFDILSPGYFASAPFTLIFKFIMGFVCGLVSNNTDNRLRNIVASVLGTSSYILLYTFKNFFKNMYLINIPLYTNLVLIGKGTVICVINAVLAVVIAVSLFEIIKKTIPNIKAI